MKSFEKLASLVLSVSVFSLSSLCYAQGVPAGHPSSMQSSHTMNHSHTEAPPTKLSPGQSPGLMTQPTPKSVARSQLIKEGIDPSVVSGSDALAGKYVWTSRPGVSQPASRMSAQYSSSAGTLSEYVGPDGEVAGYTLATPDGRVLSYGLSESTQSPSRNFEAMGYDNAMYSPSLMPQSNYGITPGYQSMDYGPAPATTSYQSDVVYYGP